MNLHQSTQHLARRVTTAILAACCALTLFAGASFAGAAPLIDGNGNDMVSFADAFTGSGCAINREDPRNDIAVADPTYPSCATREDPDNNGSFDYFVNGFDLRRFVFVYDRPNQTAYILWRMEGIVGDTDGNRNPDNSVCPEVPGTQFPDLEGISGDEKYQARIDLNCDGIFDIIIKIGDIDGTADNISVTGVATGTTTIAYRKVGDGSVISGRDLEMKIEGISLPPAFRVAANVNAEDDGPGEDNFLAVPCGEAVPSIDLAKSVNVAQICPGGSADFTLVVTNTGNVDLANVTLVDDLDAGLVYQSTVSNTCGGGVAQNGNQLTYGPFSLATGASCTIVIRVGRTAECAGTKLNNARVDAQFQSACVNGGEAVNVFDTASASVLCGNVQCSIEAPDTRVCGAELVRICGPAGEYDYAWSKNGQPLAETTQCINVGAGTYSLVVTDRATRCVSSNPCSVIIEQDTPLIEVTKTVSPEGPVDQGAVLSYTITVTNPAWSTITAQNVVVTDVLCDESVYAGNANPAPTSAPNVGDNGTIVWNVGPLAPGASATITFDARIRVLDAPACEATDRRCENTVHVSTSCGDKEVTDDDSVNTPIIACTPQGLCRLTGGGCLNEDGDNRGRKQSTFGGNSSPFHEGGGPTGNSWQHVYRDGKTILFNWHSWDAYVTRCTVVGSGPCSPQAENTKAEFQGTGKFSRGPGSREEAGNMKAYIIDHREGACNRNSRDEYWIQVREGVVIGEGAIVFETSGEIDCGNLQIHETPRWLFSGGTQQPGTLNEVESVALLNRAVPNPFRGNMSYAFEVVGESQPVDVGVYNVAGRLVKSLVRETMPAGRHTATWNGQDDNGARVPSGVYFVRARYGAEQKQQRVIYLGQ